ncbi:hypothetical protein [Spirosoma sp. KNUC1025]|uniref:hypothetical protein n=1 Tax=Spirosoma sp. KNUC1025 TaxID=2894082 RepID=UPI00386DBDF7|nr:hypothetical protein LN737_22315 [Spirosoma sp. KNUC1025]
MHYFLVVVVGILLLASCGTSSTKSDQPEAGKIEAPFKLPYDLNAPDETYKLPKELEEVSGLSYYKENQLLCVQDEEAVAYVFDTKKRKLRRILGSEDMVILKVLNT